MLDKRYWNGTKNKLIRHGYYIGKGLDSLNPARYYIASIFVIYAFLKIDNIWIIPIMFICGLPILDIIGWLYVHHMAKVMEWLGIEFSTHFSRYNIDLQEKMLQELRDIKNELKKNNN